MAPRYPSVMLNSGQEGYVVFSFTVDEEGYVREPEVIEESDFRYMSGRRTGSSMSVPARDRSFRVAAQEAVERFRYAPRFEDGKPVATAGVKTRITFKLED
jgi:outer membrane biosynthesis protein TonB